MVRCTRLEKGGIRGEDEEGEENKEEEKVEGAPSAFCGKRILMSASLRLHLENT